MRLAASLGDLCQSDGEQALVRHEVVHHAELEGLLRDNRFASENEVERLGQTDETREPRAAAPRRQDAELHFGQTELRSLVRRGEAEVAGEADLEAAAQARTVNRGSGRQRKRGEPAEDALAELNHLAQCVHRRGGERMQVRAGDEDAGLGAGEHDAAQGGITLDAIKVGVQLFQRGAVKDVHRGIGPVKCEHGDGVGGDFAPDVFKHARGGGGLWCVHHVEGKLRGGRQGRGAHRASSGG